MVIVILLSNIGALVLEVIGYVNARWERLSIPGAFNPWNANLACSLFYLCCFNAPYCILSTQKKLKKCFGEGTDPIPLERGWETPSQPYPPSPESKRKVGTYPFKHLEEFSDELSVRSKETKIKQSSLSCSPWALGTSLN